MQVITTNSLQETDLLAAKHCIRARLGARHKKTSSEAGLTTDCTITNLYKEPVDRHPKYNLSSKQYHIFNLHEYNTLAPSSPQSRRYFMQKHLFNRLDKRRQHTDILYKKSNSHQPDVEYESNTKEFSSINLRFFWIGSNSYIGVNEAGSITTSRARVNSGATDTKFCKNGLFVELARGVFGQLHRSIMGSSHPFAVIKLNYHAIITYLGSHIGETGAILVLRIPSSGAIKNNENLHILGGWGFNVSDYNSGTRAYDRSALAPMKIEYYHRKASLAKQLIEEGETAVIKLLHKLQDMKTKHIPLMGGYANFITPLEHNEFPGIFIPLKGDALDGTIFMTKNLVERN